MDICSFLFSSFYFVNHGSCISPFGFLRFFFFLMFWLPAGSLIVLAMSRSPHGFLFLKCIYLFSLSSTIMYLTWYTLRYKKTPHIWILFLEIYKELLHFWYEYFWTVKFKPFQYRRVSWLCMSLPQVFHLNKSGMLERHFIGCF